MEFAYIIISLMIVVYGHTVISDILRSLRYAAICKIWCVEVSAYGCIELPILCEQIN